MERLRNSHEQGSPSNNHAATLIPQPASSYGRLSTLCLLYFVQGAPYGFQTSCLPIILREAGMSYTALGAMKMLFLPWVCKPIYAPIIERTKTRGI